MQSRLSIINTQVALPKIMYHVFSMLAIKTYFSSSFVHLVKNIHLLSQLDTWTCKFLIKFLWATVTCVRKLNVWSFIIVGSLRNFKKKLNMDLCNFLSVIHWERSEKILLSVDYMCFVRSKLGLRAWDSSSRPWNKKNHSKGLQQHSQGLDRNNLKVLTHSIAILRYWVSRVKVLILVGTYIY